MSATKAPRPIPATHGWLGFVVIVAALVTPVLASAVAWLVDATEDGVIGNPSTSVKVLPLMFILIATLAVTRRGVVPRIVRLALVTTAAQVGLAFAAWAIWADDGNAWADLVTVPLSAALTWAVASTVAIATLAMMQQSRRARRRVPAWLRPAVVFAISNLLLFGLWLPLLAALWPPSVDLLLGASISSNPVALALAIAPPALLAAFAATLPAKTIAQHGGPLAVVLITAILAGVAVRGDATVMAMQIYGEFVPLLIAYMLGALAAITVLAAAQLRALLYHRRDARMPAPWVQRGVAVGRDGQPTGTWLGTLCANGLLGGFTSELDAFRVQTANGLVEVPRGSMLSLPLPPSCSEAGFGEVVATLRVGDPVVVAGYAAARSDGAFRTNTAPVPSGHGLIVRGPGDISVGATLAYLLWRPCALYLLAVSAVALPGLVGLPL